MQDTLLGIGSICFLFDSYLLGRLNSVIVRLMHNDPGVPRHYCSANKTDIYVFLNCPRVQKKCEAYAKGVCWEAAAQYMASKDLDTMLTDERKRVTR